MIVLAVDPGNKESAFVIMQAGKLILFGKWANATLLRSIYVDMTFRLATRCAIETMKPRGMPTAFEEMQTQLWAGRFYEAWTQTAGGDKFGLAEATQIFRADEKMCLCGQARANDSTIRQAIIDRFGGKDKAIGNKKAPGPLYGVSGDVWQAIAVAITFIESPEFKK